jgi:hypothetical protein
MKQLSELSASQQQSIKNRYILPEDTSKVLILERGISRGFVTHVPIEMYGNCKVACTLKKNALVDGNFHRR